MKDSAGTVLPQESDEHKASYREFLIKSVRENIRQYTMIISLIVIWIIFTVLTDGIFLTPRNLSNLFLQMVTIGILASGMVFVIVATHIDLSVGSVAGTLGALAAALMVKVGLGPIPAILLTLLGGILIGCWHGFWIAYRGVPAFIVTLASMSAFKGLTLAITRGATIGEFPLLFKSIGQGYVPRLFFQDAAFHDTSILIGAAAIILYIVFDMKKRKSRQKYDFEVLPMPLQILKIILISLVIAMFCSIMISYRGIPYAILLLTGIVIILSFVSQKTKFGRYIYAFGGNKEATRLSGINTKQVNFFIFVLMGFLTSVAAIVFAARLNAATTSAGSLFELDAIAACFIGGTSTLGGVGTVFGAIIGALVMASIDNGMSLMNVNIMYQYIIKGAILLLAVWIDFSTKKKA
ncbi:sugar ABC transporter permease [Geosporobacter ferrireducens]|uniref:Xylose transport system permease protein XylH n=1 Tax=Geosporobacter ferrireducens TaxID=1424294 RepID=A0A1D8GNZ9_9FIRM|nr:sugar ABC transporter permease [Geosporobacter ferrireducens]AOT72615.1 sugar ABC transporter permease [Geosporobacter ferrireducens]